MNQRSGTRSFLCWRTGEGIAWLVGIALMVDCGASYLGGTIASRQMVRRFAELRAAAQQQQARAPDLTLWSEKRIDAWRNTLDAAAPAPLAVLRIPRIGLEVPVLEGTDEFTLNRAVGHIGETAIPGAEGNSGIAGHRDGFFRGLKDVRPGDVVELETLNGRESYLIERAWIVKPDDIGVLDPTPVPSLTFVTCYPFYFIGPAPNRYIVRALRASNHTGQ
jgi:sortase A